MRYRPANSLSCVECGADRPQFASRCPCGSAHVAQALPNEDTLNMDEAWVYGPMCGAYDVEVMHASVNHRRMCKPAPVRSHEPTREERARIKLIKALPFV